MPTRVVEYREWVARKRSIMKNNAIKTMDSFQSINAAWQQKAKELGLEKLHHIKLDNIAYESMQLFSNLKLYDHPLYADLSDGIKTGVDKYKIANNSDSISAEVTTKRPKTTKVWPRTQNLLSELRYTPNHVLITLPNSKPIHFWVMHVKSIQNDGDVVWAFLSFDEQNRKAVEDFINLTNEIRTASFVHERTVQVYGASTVSIQSKYTWDDLVLPDHIIRSVKDDLEFWMAMEDHYKEKRIPYRRGYLFEGPPGNGKTATARVILSSYDFAGFMFNFSNRSLDDGDLLAAFHDAATSAPSVFLLEDIDRIFDNSHFCNITLECLFNCLDGIAINEGVVVIATANHPEVLDAAIRKRPGRFDVPVKFDNPPPAQREQFFKKLFGNDISLSTFHTLVDQTEGMSMAFLKLVYETAGVTAFKEINNGRCIIRDNHALEGLHQALKYYEQSTIAKERGVGFNPSDNKKIKQPRSPSNPHAMCGKLEETSDSIAVHPSSGDYPTTGD